jgi:hypothetical protein
MGDHYAHHRAADQRQGLHYSDFRDQTAPKCLIGRPCRCRQAQNRSRIREVGLIETINAD